MLEKIKNGIFIIVLCSLGLLAYFFGKRGEKINDLQSKILKEKLDKELQINIDQVKGNEKTYVEAYNDYTTKRDNYLKLLKKPIPRSSD